MIFRKETFQNILIPGANSRIPELSVEERVVFYSKLEEYGLKKGRAYSRIFRNGVGSGFDEWELMGIRQAVRQFASEYGIACSEEDLPSFYTEKLDGMREAFWGFMNEKGMSRATCIYRFKNWNFQPWELMGVQQIIDELCKQTA